MCTFCPQDKLNRAYKDPIRVMSLETFCCAIDKLTPDYKIIFAGYTEPWTNPLCTQFVRIALQRGFEISIYTTLYNLSLAEADELADLLEQHHMQVTGFWIHCPDQKGNMRGFRHSPEYDRVLNRVLSMQRARPMVMTMDEQSTIHPDVQVKVQPASWYLHTRADNLDLAQIKDQPVHLPPKYEYIVECTRDKDLKANILLPNGDVILCCMDYGLKHRLGNLLRSTMQEIHDGHERQKVIKLSNQLGYTDELLCKSCNDAFCHTPWNNKKVHDLVLSQNPDFQL
jgi:hypothetical protein